MRRLTIPIINLDNLPQADAPTIYIGESLLTVDGPDLDQSLFEGDEVIGARMFAYRGGRFWVHPNIYERGHSLRKVPIRGWLNRWLTSKGFGTNVWSYQVSYAGSMMSSSALTRRGAVADCKQWIDEEVAK